MESFYIQKLRDSVALRPQTAITIVMTSVLFWFYVKIKVQLEFYKM